MRDKFPHIVSILVIVVLSWYYFIQLGRPISLSFINAVAAFASTFLISFSFIIGPLSRFSQWFFGQLKYRKDFGLWGYGLAVLHTGLVTLILLSNVREISFADIVSIAFAAIAFMIFTLMALTSTQAWMQKLTYDNWKNLQRTGYLAFAFLLFHILLLEKGIFLTRLTGQIAMSFILLTLFLRALVLVLRIPSVEKIEL